MATLTRRLSGDLLRFDIEEEALRLMDSRTLATSGRSARTLAKDGVLRVTLVALGPGHRIPAHRAEGPITIQPIHGLIHVEIGEERVELGPADLLSLGGGVEHAVSSGVGAVFLLTITSPEDV